MNKCQNCQKEIPIKWSFCNDCVRESYAHAQKEEKLLALLTKNITTTYKIESMRREVIASRELIQDQPFIVNPNTCYKVE